MGGRSLAGNVSTLNRLTLSGGLWLRKREAQRAGEGGVQEGPFNFVRGHSLSGCHHPSL